MAYVENPIVEGKDFESVMNDVNGNFEFLKDDVNNLKQKPFTKIGEYEFKRITESVRISSSDVVYPNTTRYEIYQIQDDKKILIDSGTEGNNNDAKEIQVSVLPFEQILIAVKLEVGRAMRASFETNPATCMSNTSLIQSIGTMSISTDHRWAGDDDHLITTAKTPSYSCRYTYYAKGTPFLESEGNSFTNDKKRTFSLKSAIYSQGIADDKYGYYWLTDSDGNPVMTKETYSYLNKNPEECYGIVNMAVYTVSDVVSDFNGIDWDNLWTET